MKRSASWWSTPIALPKSTTRCARGFAWSWRKATGEDRDRADADGVDAGGEHALDPGAPGAGQGARGGRRGVSRVRVHALPSPRARAGLASRHRAGDRADPGSVPRAGAAGRLRNAVLSRAG